MPTFAYTILEQGERRDGTVDAPHAQAAVAQIKKPGVTILKMAPATGPKTVALGSWHHARMVRRLFIRPFQMETALAQLAQLIKAGVPILTALESVSQQAPGPLRGVFNEIRTRVKKGQSLERSMRACAPFIGNVALGLMGVGEANGTLDEMLKYAAELMAKRRKVKAQVMGALAYPALVIVGAFGLGYYMVNKVIPQVMNFIGTQDPAALPKITQYLILTNDFLLAYGVYILVTPVVLVLGFVAARRHTHSAPIVDRAILQVPPIGKALRDHANTMWCRTLGALLRSGIDILTALELVRQTVGNAYFAVRFARIRGRIRQGATCSRSFTENDMQRWCPMAVAMMAVSEESGGMDESLLHIADYYEEQLGRRVALLAKMVEPAVFIIVGGMVGFVYYAFFLAMLTATTSAGR
jgi:type IV pilus assembly protein PilC